MEILSVKDLSFTYQGSNTAALKDVSFTACKGEFTVLCGGSGSGKTTLLRLIKKEIAPFGKLCGEIKINGGENDCDVGFIPQNPDSMIVTDRVQSELSFGLESLALPPEEIRRRIAEISCCLGISGLYGLETASLSGGQKQLLNLASVMVMQPEILLLDEPAAQLDPVAAEAFYTALFKLVNDFGTTVIMTEHNLESVFAAADRILLAEEGRIIFDGSPQESVKSIYASIPGSLPSSAGIWLESGIQSECPLSVNEGIKFLNKSCKNEIRTLPVTEQQKATIPAIRIKELWHRYGKNERDVLKGLDLDIFKGEVHSITGANGCGKSTLLKIIAGQLKPYSGKVQFKDAASKRLALLPQTAESVFITDSIEEDLKLVSNDYSNICEDLRISHLLSCHPYDLSGGELQKCAIVKLLLTKPQLLLADEPTNGVDSNGRQALKGIFRALAKEGVTVVCVTHDIEFAAEVSDRITMLFNGKTACSEEADIFLRTGFFYTTAARRISRGFYDDCVTSRDVVKLIKMNQGKRPS